MGLKGGLRSCHLLSTGSVRGELKSGRLKVRAGPVQLQCILSGQEAECVTFGVRFTR